MEKKSKKLIILYVYDILKYDSSEDNILGAIYIARQISENYGIECDRRTVMRNIQYLREYGCEIAVVRGKGYYMQSFPIRNKKKKLNHTKTQTVFLNVRKEKDKYVAKIWAKDRCIKLGEIIEVSRKGFHLTLAAIKVANYWAPVFGAEIVLNNGRGFARLISDIEKGERYSFQMEVKIEKPFVFQ